MRGVAIGSPSRSGYALRLGGTRRRPLIDPLWVELGTLY